MDTLLFPGHRDLTFSTLEVVLYGRFIFDLCSLHDIIWVFFSLSIFLFWSAGYDSCEFFFFFFFFSFCWYFTVDNILKIWELS
jgi:hypothetical protein